MLILQGCCILYSGFLMDQFPGWQNFKQTIQQCVWKERGNDCFCMNNLAVKNACVCKWTQDVITSLSWQTSHLGEGAYVSSSSVWLLALGGQAQLDTQWPLGLQRLGLSHSPKWLWIVPTRSICTRVHSCLWYEEESFEGKLNLWYWRFIFCNGDDFKTSSSGICLLNLAQQERKKKRKKKENNNYNVVTES